MCMKNINMNVVFADIISSEETTNISLGNVTGKRFYVSQEANKRMISQIGFAVFVSATESKDVNYVTQADPDLTFVFKEKYDVRIRLTETISGNFKDLGEFILDPSASCESDGLCRKTFSYAHYCLYSNVALPEVKEREKFVIKLLIRRRVENRVQDDGWVVQTICPLKLDNK